MMPKVFALDIDSYYIVPGQFILYRLKMVCVHYLKMERPPRVAFN